jgi:hypothetical protein
MKIFFTHCQLVILLCDIRLIIKRTAWCHIADGNVLHTLAVGYSALWHETYIFSYKGLLFLYLLLLSIWQINDNELRLHYFPVTEALYHRCRKRTSLPVTDQWLNPKRLKSQYSRYHRYSSISAQAPFKCLHLSNTTCLPFPSWVALIL